MDQIILGCFKKLVAEYQLKRFYELRTRVIHNESYQPYSINLKRMEQLLQEQRWQDVLDKMKDDRINLLLSPRAHYLVSLAMKHLDMSQEADTEQYIAAIMARGILDSGDGSHERPYLITRPSDEIDIANALKKKPVRQTYLQEPDRTLDRVHYEDGSELHFDNTPCSLALSQIVPHQNEDDQQQPPQE